MNVQINNSIKIEFAAFIAGLSKTTNTTESNIRTSIEALLADPQEGDPGFMPFLDLCACAPGAEESTPVIAACACQL